MQTILLATNDTLWLVVGISVFVIVWAMVHKALKEMPLFDSPLSRGILTTCVALLSVIGIFHHCVSEFGTAGVSGDSDTQSRTVHFILLPYAALGVTMVLIALFVYISKLRRRVGTDVFAERIKGRPESTGRSTPDRVARALHDEMAKVCDRPVMNKDILPRPNPSDKPFAKQSHPKRMSDQGKSNRIQQ